MQKTAAAPEGDRPHIPEDRTLLLVDDDIPFLTRLARAMEGRGFEVSTASTVKEGKELARTRKPGFAVVDMRLEDGNGLDVVAALEEARPEARIVVLTGYGNIATAVTAVKLGAADYLEARRRRCHRCGADGATGADKAGSPKIRCRPTACAGNISSASTSFATATSRKRRVASTCTAAPCNASSPSARRNRAQAGSIILIAASSFLSA